MYKFVFIDIDNTLLDFNKCAKATMSRVLKEYNIEFENYMFEIFLKINDKLWIDIENGLITKEDLYKVRWSTIFKEIGILIDGIEFEKRFIILLEESAEPVPYAKQILEYLSSKYIVCAVSNAPHNQQEARLKKAGMMPYVSYLFTSEKSGYEKPNKLFFDNSFNELGNISLNDVILIGDSLSADIFGGIAYGIKTCWFNYRHETLPKDIKPNYIVNSLLEIKNIM